MYVLTNGIEYIYYDPITNGMKRTTDKEVAAKFKKHSFSAVFRENRAFYGFYSAITFKYSDWQDKRLLCSRYGNR